VSALRTAAGFTIIELMLVIAVVGILAMLAYPKVNFTQFQMDSGARVVRSTLQTAQRLAVTRQYDMVVSFDLATHRMRVLEDRNNDNVADAGERITWRAFDDSIHFATPPAALDGGVAPAAVTGPGVIELDGMPSVIFRRDGAASTELDIYLSSRRAQSNDYRGVHLVRATSRTEWFRYIDGKWKQASL
jgi:prepilin-type N-terminal cleavage/methylation domain-containing protein